MKKIVIGADPFAYPLKKVIFHHLEEKGVAVLDADRESGDSYYTVAQNAAERISNGDADAGILLCGTGAGMCIVANKFPKITAVACESVFTAAKCRAINHANVMTMGAMVVGNEMACAMVDAFLETKFTEGFESLADFLKEAEKQVNAIDSAHRK